MIKLLLLILLVCTLPSCGIIQLPDTEEVYKLNPLDSKMRYVYIHSFQNGRIKVVYFQIIIEGVLHQRRLLFEQVTIEESEDVEVEPVFIIHKLSETLKLIVPKGSVRR